MKNNSKKSFSSNLSPKRVVGVQKECLSNSNNYVKNCFETNILRGNKLFGHSLLKSFKKLVLFSTISLICTALPSKAEERSVPNIPNGNHLMLFEEGTPNIVAPHTWKKDLFYGSFSHIWFLQSFPKGSNPSAFLSYTPVDNFQVDVIATLRDGFETEFGAKYQVFNQFKGDFLSLTPRIAYNTRGNIFGLDLSADKVFFKDRLSLGLNYTIFNTGEPDGVKGVVQALGANSILRIFGHWYLFGDTVIPLDPKLIASKGFVWSAGIKDQMRGTPHNATIYIGNSNLRTLSGRTLSVNNIYPDVIRVGFEFSVIIEELRRLPELIFFAGEDFDD